MTTINYITDEIIELRTTDPEIIGKMKDDSQKLQNDDTILKYEELAGEIRMFIELAEEPDSDSSFLDRLRYIHWKFLRTNLRP